jgi:aspartyl-tRNA(Asn)/glutamyl-tRNA(Gln) amidotransferase subunit A
VLACIAGQGMPFPDLRTLRIGVLRQHFPTDPLNRQVADVVETALARLGSMTLRDISIPALDKVNRVLMDLLLPEASLIHSDLARGNPGGYAIGTLSQIRAGEGILATRYLAARQQQALIRAAVDALFDQCDVLLSVTVPFTAPFEDPEIANDADSEILATGFSNVTGHPSIALPCGMIAGLPVSLQLTGALGGDAALLSAATLIERTLAV